MWKNPEAFTTGLKKYKMLPEEKNYTGLILYKVEKSNHKTVFVVWFELNFL